MTEKSLQELYAPENRCFGCGPANDQGLRLRSFASEDGLIATWTPQKHHEAFDNMLNGGIIGTLLDCHCNWAAAYHLMQQGRVGEPPCTVTAQYSISLHAPTRTDGPIKLTANVTGSSKRSVQVSGQLLVDQLVTATCQGTFVAVKPGHPAYHRW